MAREIKFRAWTKGGMLHDIGFFMKSIGEVNGKNIEVPERINEGIKHIQEKGTILMQFSGLKDKDGKEIYEGDILKSRIGNREITGVMYFNEKRAQFGMDNVIQSKKKVPESIELHSPPEIIGNIYENPELLK